MNNAPPGRRQRKREEKTRLLQETAFSILDEHGLEGLTMPVLADRADVAVGGLYRYFASKQDLIVSLQVAAIQDLQRWMVQNTTHTGVEGLRQAVLSMPGYAERAPTRFALLEAAVSDPRRVLDDPSAATVEKALAPLLAHVRVLHDQAVTTGDLAAGDAVQRTLVLWGLAFGCLHHRKRDGRASDVAHRAAEVLEAGLNGLIAGWR